MPQTSGWRAIAFEKTWRLWQAEQVPRVPSGFTRPIPVFGQVAGSRTGAPMALFWTEPSAFFRKARVEPWHCQQPFTAASRPSTISPRMLSSEPMNFAALAWWLAWNSVDDRRRGRARRRPA